MGYGKHGIRRYATFIEYALLAGLVAIVVAAAVAIFSGKLSGLFKATGDKVDTVSSQVSSADLGGGGKNVQTQNKPSKPKK